jgi:arylsulfatase A-like enzyme
MIRCRVVALLVLLAAAPAAALDLLGTIATVPKAALFPSWHAGAASAWGDDRMAITTPIPNQFDAAVEVPPHARLRVGFAMLDRFLGADVLPQSEPTRFTVDFKNADGTVERVTERVLDPRGNPADRRWVDVDADMSRFAGRQGVLQFRLTVAADPQGVNKTSGLLSRPVLYDAEAQRARPNLLFVTIDALRADHVGAYGYARPTTPNLDALARDGVRFAHAYTSAPMTVPSLPQFFSSRVFPVPQTPTLLSSLVQGGVADTKAIVHNPFLEAWLRLHARDGFASVTSGNWRADKITRAALHWIDAHRDRRWALYLHYLDTHTPYMVRGEAALMFADPAHRGAVGRRFDDTATAAQGGFDAGDRAQIEALYDGAIHFVDEQIGLLLAGLAERGLLEKTLVVVSADHGEEQWDHGSYFHGQSLYDELLHVPLIVRFPERAHAGRVVETMVRSIDVVPTMADALTLPVFPEFEGRTLVSLIDGATEVSVPSLHARAANPRFPYRFAVRTPTHKLIATVETGREELYDLAADPAEHDDRIADPALGAVRQALRADLADLRAPLRTLGYQVRAASADGQQHAIEVLVASEAGGRVADNPDRVDLAAGDRIESNETERTLRWTGTVGDAPAGFRFDQGMLQDDGGDPGLRFDIRVDGRPIAPGAVRLGADGTAAPSMPFTYRRVAKDVYSAPAEQPALLAAAAPRLVPIAGQPVTVWIWRFPGSAAGGTAASAPVDAETTRRLRALGYAD